LSDRQKIKGIYHYVYDDVDEFRNDHPSLVVHPDWRKADEDDWVHSDDGRIVQLLKVKKEVNHPGDRKNYKYAQGWVRTVVGCFLNRQNIKMDTDFSLHESRYTFGGKHASTQKRIKERKNITSKEREFATNVVIGMGAVDAYKTAYRELSNQKARKKATLLLKQERVMKEIEKTVLDIAKGLGIDHEYVLSKLKNLADYSEDDNIILQSTKELGKIVGTAGTTIKQREVGVIGMFQGFSQDELQGADRGQSKLEENIEIKSKEE
jgi:hypothetical protein